ncbi:plasmid stabilization protein [Leucobacter sp. OLJS4]|uniref:type II toxin-antitoxin system RelE family toxin n=1 Tax=unclassified Leucobacter TaxID=2621730 RepID=UPI000C187431|nr:MULTISPECIES: type II toxin-antitoxin system RelE/ParE family toxin [unclassified Leucobacter]PIJ12501.1 plasmid stabilization protein [Leucobacter sp. OLES1]PII82410.1 plasmid stabilization protein [Leucobacter sp. OLCALW19]PII87409.1 plasmid stabilization protein [Leucobacter sp. OLTLW20]PII94534.1 plasmid stabilization protein [Leucobacter sp. OLAS13]PIJ00667.1 plasmid stabilization protein [Leucobacter sp. OLDS2]
MIYAVEFTSAAAKQIRRLPRPARERLLDAIENLQADPRPPGAKKLVGEDLAWRIRTGDYRVIYEVADDRLLVTVVRAAHRREVYR